MWNPIFAAEEWDNFNLLGVYCAWCYLATDQPWISIKIIGFSATCTNTTNAQAHLLIELAVQDVWRVGLVVEIHCKPATILAFEEHEKDHFIRSSVNNVALSAGYPVPLESVITSHYCMGLSSASSLHESSLLGMSCIWLIATSKYCFISWEVLTLVTDIIPPSEKLQLEKLAGMLMLSYALPISFLQMYTAFIMLRKCHDDLFLLW